MNPKNDELRIKAKANWRMMDGEPSPAWVRLWHKLLAKREEKSGSTLPDVDGGCENDNKRNLQN